MAQRGCISVKQIYYNSGGCYAVFACLSCRIFVQNPRSCKRIVRYEHVSSEPWFRKSIERIEGMAMLVRRREIGFIMRPTAHHLR